MSAGRRRPGVHGAATLVLLGIVFLGVGVLLYLQDDDRSLVARDLGDVPGAASTAPASRPLSTDIPVLVGLDQLLAPGTTAPVPGVPAAGTTPSAVPQSVAQSVAQPSGVALPGAVLPGVGAPAASLTGAALPGAVVPAAGTSLPALTGPGAAGPGTTATGSAEPTPDLADPRYVPPSPRPLPRPLPTPEQPIAAQQPGFVSPLYALPAPTPVAAPRAPLVPARLELPARAVTAPVAAVGTGPNGGMVVPEEVRTVGWWAPGVAPGGAAGSAVIAGHVDSRTAGLGVLSVLPQLTEGEPLLVGDTAGRTVAYRVVARREYRKYDLPRDVFRRDGAPQLVLITCGGVFDPVARSYESNIVVYAVPA